MNKINDGGLAYPYTEPDIRTDGVAAIHIGATLRDWFAGRATDGDVNDIQEDDGNSTSPKWITRTQARYVHADRMLAEREKAK